MPGSGKTTLAWALRRLLEDRFINTILIDGDVIRMGLSADLSHTPEGKSENIRRISHMAEILDAQGKTVIVSAVTPTPELRMIARKIAPTTNLIHLKVNREVCRERRILASEAFDFIEGSDAHYTIEQNDRTPEQCAEDIMDRLYKKA